MLDFNKLLNAKRVTVNYLDVDVNGETVKKFRQKNGLTQIAFANIMGVSKKTVEKWEQGVNKLSGSSAVLLTLLNDEPDILHKVYNVQIVDRTYTDYKTIVNCTFDTPVMEEMDINTNIIFNDIYYKPSTKKKELVYAGGI